MKEIAEEAISRLNSIENELVSIEEWARVCQAATNALRKYKKSTVHIQIEDGERHLVYRPLNHKFGEVLQGKWQEVLPRNGEELKHFSEVLIQAVAVTIAPVIKSGRKVK